MKRFPLLYTSIILLVGFIFSMYSCKSSSGVSSAGPGLISVTVDEGIDIQQVKIEWIGAELGKIVVFEKGTSTNAEIPQALRDVFEVYVGTRVIGGGGVNRSQGAEKNDFIFHIGKDGKSLQLEMRVKGPDSTNGFYVKRYIRDLVGNISRIEFYGPKGLKTHETYEKLSINGELEAENRLDYAYDSEGRKILQKHTVSSPEGDIISSNENIYAYDEAGREKEQTFRSYGPASELKVHNVNRFLYNIQGKLSEKEFISYDKNGETVSHFITAYLYNQEGYNVEDLQYNADRVLLHRIERSFNAQGSIVKESFTEYLPDGKVKSVHGRDYDDKGKILKEF